MAQTAGSPAVRSSGARRRGGSFRDMVLTLAIFALGVLAVVAFLPKSHSSAAGTPKAYAVSLQALRSAAPFPVYAPAVAPAGWTPNHVATHVATAVDPAYSLDLGFYVLAVKQYLAVEQSSAPGFVTAQLGGGARQTGAETVGATAWQTWTDSSGHPALVRAVTGGSATSMLVLTGVTDDEHLRALAASLSLGRATDVPGAQN